MSKDVMTNTQIIDSVLKGTNLYQLGVPNPTQVGIERTYRYMMSPNNRDIYNKFVDGLFRLIGTQLIRTREYINPLANFKRMNVNRQQSIQEIGFHLVKARAYNQFDVDKFWEENHPEVEIAYHSQNRQDKFKISVNNAGLESAFLTEYGLSNFVSGALQQPINSDNYTEYNIMKDLMAKYENRYGFYKIKVPELTGNNQMEMEFNTKQFIKAVRTIAGQWSLKYDTKYNGYHLPVFTPLGKTYLVTTPEVIASVDVDVLASAFNMSSAELQQRTVLVDEIPVKDCYALLLDEDWFVCGDTLYENRSWENPETLSINYFLHHWGVLSTSPMLNCCAFVTTEGTLNEETTVTPKGTFEISLHDESGANAEHIVLGEKNYLKGSLAWTVEPASDHIPNEFIPTNFEVVDVKTAPVAESATVSGAPEGTTVNVTPATFGAKVSNKDGKYNFVKSNSDWKLGEDTVTLSEYGIEVSGDGTSFTVDYVSAKAGVSIPLNSRTYVDNYGMMHFQAAVAEGMSVTVKGTSTYNSDGVGIANKVSAEKTFTVSAK